MSLTASDPHWHRVILGFGQDVPSLGWTGWVESGAAAVDQATKAITDIWHLLCRMHGLPHQVLPDHFDDKVRDWDLDAGEGSGHQIDIFRVVALAIEVPRINPQLKRLRVKDLKTLVEQLAWSDNTIRNHIMEKGSVEISMWSRSSLPNEPGVQIGYEIFDARRKFIFPTNISSLTISLLFLMLTHRFGLVGAGKRRRRIRVVIERPGSAVLRAICHQAVPHNLKALISYCVRVNLMEHRSSLEAILGQMKLQHVNEA